MHSTQLMVILTLLINEFERIAYNLLELYRTELGTKKTNWSEKKFNRLCVRVCVTGLACLYDKVSLILDDCLIG